MGGSRDICLRLNEALLACAQKWRRPSFMHSQLLRSAVPWLLHTVVGYPVSQSSINRQLIWFGNQSYEISFESQISLIIGKANDLPSEIQTMYAVRVSVSHTNYKPSAVPRSTYDIVG
jgi:hypothetical protein